MNTKVTLALQAEDAEPFLRKAATEAAKYSAWCDHITIKTYFSPHRKPGTFEDERADWRRRFLSAKRIVEAFGVEYEQTSEEETMTVHFEHVGGKRKIVNLGSLGPVGWITGSKPDYKHPKPAYWGGVHEEACKQAAERVVRRWKETLAAKAAA